MTVSSLGIVQWSTRGLGGGGGGWVLRLLEHPPKAKELISYMYDA